MKPVCFLGNALDSLRAFPDAARSVAGYQIERLQHGLDPDDWKPMKSIGNGVREIRVRDASGASGASGAYRVIYIASMKDAIYVLHAFQKKTQTTSRHDIYLATERFKDLIRNLKR